MTPGKLKALGTALLLLALVGSLSSVSAVLAGGDALTYLFVNLILFGGGLLTLRLGYRRAKDQGNPEIHSYRNGAREPGQIVRDDAKKG